MASTVRRSAPDTEVNRTTLTIYISSPGDVKDERLALVKALERLSMEPFARDKADLRVASYDHPTLELPLPANENPQAAVNRFLGTPSQADVVVAILWSRFGTPLPESVGTRHDGSRFDSGTEWEIHDALTAEPPPYVLIYRKTTPPNTDPNSQAHRVQQYVEDLARDLKRAGRGSIQRFETTDAFAAKAHLDLRELVYLALGLRSRRRVWDPTRSPYPGLLAFTPADTDVFFGRDHDVARLNALVDTKPLCAVVGPSGSGKSSVVGAGLIPRLNDLASLGSPRWLTPSFTPAEGWRGPWMTPGAGENPVATLETGLRALGLSGADCVELCQHADGRVLIVVDQFEEVFTTLTHAARDALFDTLVALASEHLGKVVLSLRAEFLGHALEHPGLAGHLRTATLPLAPPGQSAIRQMIAEPAAIAGLRFETDVDEWLLTDAGKQPGGLPLLAFALGELYEMRTADGLLTRRAYERIGGVAGAVGTLADRAFDPLPEAVRRQFNRVFLGLAGIDEVGGPVRRPLRLESVAEPEGRELIDALVDARLLVTSKDDDPVVEIAHEAVFRGWPRLRGWLNRVHDDMWAVQRMRQAAADWHGEAGAGDCERERGYLWPEERMAPVREALARLHAEDQLARHEREFLRPEAERLIEELALPKTIPVRRRAISARLGAIGDPRPGVGVGADDVPEIAWCRVGEQPAFWIARYPVTVAQYRAYRRATWEADEGVVTDLDGVQDNLPVSCTWREAISFCGWLQRSVARCALPSDDPCVIRLPTEGEWMRAGAAPYPWGETWDDCRANAASGGLREPIAVGMYPLGGAPSGAQDLAGNVWEWCDDDAHDDDLRLLKGGSVLESPTTCRTVAARRVRGDLQRDDRGFRVCFGPR